LSQDASINDVPAEDRGKIQPGSAHGAPGATGTMQSPNTGTTEHHVPGQTATPQQARPAATPKKGGNQ
jgi:hypothetical protein